MNNDASLVDYNNDSVKAFASLYKSTNRLISGLFLVINSIDEASEIKRRIKEISL